MVNSPRNSRCSLSSEAQKAEGSENLLKESPKRGFRNELKRYQLNAKIGKGAYGTCFSALDKETGKNVAIKILHNIYGDVKELKRTVREICIMRLFQNHPHI